MTTSSDTKRFKYQIRQATDQLCFLLNDEIYCLLPPSSFKILKVQAASFMNKTKGRFIFMWSLHTQAMQIILNHVRLLRQTANLVLVSTFSCFFYHELFHAPFQFYTLQVDLWSPSELCTNVKLKGPENALIIIDCRSEYLQPLLVD